MQPWQGTALPQCWPHMGWPRCVCGVCGGGGAVGVWGWVGGGQVVVVVVCVCGVVVCVCVCGGGGGGGGMVACGDEGSGGLPVGRWVGLGQGQSAG